MDDGSCLPVIYGCMDSNYVEFNPLANTDTTMCFTEVVLGCTDVNALNYFQDANTDDGSCIDKIIGCLDLNADNYNDYDKIQFLIF
ncbi:MAG: hypothetical protein CM15mP23_18440 [Cryomorphaceae bacterium]|nr:MAG: hypothetical protein CM15mP23_18440 [Cryomorphaceae bacterium]